MSNMCGIVGVISPDFELTAIVMKQMLLQSQIRGRHATGIAYINANNKVEVFSQPKPASQFIKHNLPESQMMLGHTRYSTSDIEYNQPIGNGDIAVVHNGVITQEAFENWAEHYGYKNFKTKNDTELLLKCFETFKNPFEQFNNASIACGILNQTSLICARNNSRPLWLFSNEYFSGFASTKDIIIRAGEALELDICPMPTLPFVEYTFIGDQITERKVNHKVKEMLFSHDQQL